MVMILAKASSEVGNMGATVDPALAKALKRNFGAINVAAQGVDSLGRLSTNFLPGGADPVGIKGMKNLILSVATQCPNAAIMVGSYSQGAAVVHRSVEGLPPAVMAEVTGVVTFGDTQKSQDGARVKNFPREKTMIICNRGDAVCRGTLVILPPHLLYVNRVPEATAFMTKMAQNMGLAPVRGSIGHVSRSIDWKYLEAAR